MARIPSWKHQRNPPKPVLRQIFPRFRLLQLPSLIDPPQVCCHSPQKDGGGSYQGLQWVRLLQVLPEETEQFMMNCTWDGYV